MRLEALLIYVTVLESASCFLPVLIMVVVYALSSIRINQHVMPGADKKAECQRILQNRNMTRMFSTVVLVFFLLVTPYSVYSLLKKYKVYRMKDFETYIYLTHFLHGVSTLNHCVNPFIYARMHRNMKTSFTKILLACRSSIVKKLPSMCKDPNNNLAITTTRTRAETTFSNTPFVLE